MNIILINLSVYNDAQLVLCVMILAHAAVWPKCCLTLAGSSWKIGENISAWLYFSKLFMISYWCLTRIYYSRQTHEQDRLTSSSTELYVPLRTHINILFFLELYLNGICYTRTLLIPKPSTNLRVGSSHHPPHPCARPPPAWSWLPAFSWLRTASSSPPPPSVHILHLEVIPSIPQDKTRRQQCEVTPAARQVTTIPVKPDSGWGVKTHCLIWLAMCSRDLRWYWIN